MVKILFFILFHILLNLLFITSFLKSQIIDKPIYEMEKESHSFSFNSGFNNYKGDINIDVNYYKLNLNITYNPNFLIGEVTINCKSLVNNLNEISYDFSNNMTVDSVTSGKVRLNFSHADNKILITLNKSVNIGQIVSVIIFYKGIPVPTGYGSFIFGTHNINEPAIWTLSEPFGSSDWFPCKNVPYDKADSSDVWINCSDNLTAVSNGVLKEIQNNNNGTLTYKWHNSYPITQYVISLAISNYAQYNTYFKYSTNDSMPVLNYIYPENLDKLKSQLDKTNSMLTLFSDKFGLYPFINEKYGHAEFGRNAGMENQTISSIGVFNDNIMAHELTHQWFGDKITCADWQNIWLNEGFATYGEAIYNESAFGITAYKEFMKNKMSFAKTAVGTIYVQDANDINQIFSGNRSYAKGCVVLHMLRGITGDSVFFEILKSYATDSSIAYKNAVTEDFKRVAEKVYGADLGYFFSEWIYGEKYPEYNVSWTTENIGLNQYKASVNITQKINVNPSFFTMPIKIKIFTAGGETVKTVFNNSQSQTFDILLDSKPLNFKIDPDNYILKDVRGEDIIPVSFSLGQNFPNPFNPVTTIIYSLGKPSFVNLKVYNILGEEIGNFVNEKQREGNYTVKLNMNGFPSGAYFYSLTAQEENSTNVFFSEAKELMYIK